MPKTRVLVVEDSLTTRKHLIEVLRRRSRSYGRRRSRRRKASNRVVPNFAPDVITLDIMLPVMSGVAVTEYLMAYCPTPILVVSASMNRGELHKTYDVLAAGAVDVLDKPAGNNTDEGWEQRFVSAVKIVSRIRVITHIRGKLGPLGQVPAHPARFGLCNTGARTRMIAIGGSTGGPAAVVEILRGLPADFPIPMLLVIHISEPFGAAFAEWLDGQSKLPVRYARDGEPLPSVGQAGVVMAPPGRHLTVEHGKLRLTIEPERNSCRPSIDVLFESLAKELGGETTACLLTGMGRDGASGLLALRHAGALTFAQDEASCVVFGMPKEAFHLGAACRILALRDIAPALAALACGAELRGTN